MVFLIQHTQNRDTLALQIKVAELILTMHGAKSDLAVAEDLSEESLERIHEKFKKSAKSPQRRRQRQKRKTKSTKEPAAS
jgi:low affinity Fe/Cu permease